ncbi:DUF6000 family protein [Hymenobacter sp. HDW8]|uniref:DUF6000 family protein n=1 Tax=Hymenobacter sp. HDW8 TaxID=2714932 RepID=UPI001407C021|nr:DUF6000 family protein [Hymenobacter sp. HDW8]QIL74618.1 hypothetical protein G7064_01120 [Hymenobacter sp. HDW8]
MTGSSLWKKLFSRIDEATELALHMAGATVRHRNPFEQLEAFRNDEELSEEFIEKWVLKFYMTSLNKLDAQTMEAFVTASKEVTPDVVRHLLGDFDWRPRIVGAYFAAIKGYTELTDIIGVHLLKSEVCYAGSGYALALATFGGDQSIEYLKMYLDFYLNRKDLWFDQGSVLAALYTISPTEHNQYLNNWRKYKSDKPYSNLDNSIAHMIRSKEVVKQLGEASS